MSSLTLYGLKNCDSCKRAVKFLQNSGRDFSFVDIRSEADLSIKVPLWISVVGNEALLNKRSTTWRGLSENEQKQALDDGAEAVLITHPTLIKRPVIEMGDQVLVGWNKDVEETLI